MTSLAQSANAQREPLIQARGRALLQQARSHRPLLSRLTQDYIGLERLMGDPDVRTAALRFVDVLPALTDGRELTRHLTEYFGAKPPPLPLGAGEWALRHAATPLGAAVLPPLVRRLAHRMAHRFIAGHDAESARRPLRNLWDRGMGFTIDVLGEAVVSDAEALAYQQQYLTLLADLDPVVRAWPVGGMIDHLSGRRSPRLNLSIKVTALNSQTDPVDIDRSVALIKDRLRPIMLDARRRGAFITVDMEQYLLKDLTLRVFKELLTEPELADWPDVGIAMQAYLRDTPADVEAMIDWAKRRGTPVMVRLVRGAYWDYETVAARQRGWPVPVWTTKAHTDACYEHCLSLLLGAYPHIETAAATHNLRSLAVARVTAEERGLSPAQYELQMLYGMADPVKESLVQSGQRLRIYVPVGELIPGMAYLVRRLLENTASQSFLRMGFAENAPAAELLAPPRPEPEEPEMPVAVDGFVNEPDRRFITDAERQHFADTLARVRSQLGEHYAVIIGGKPLSTPDRLTSSDPSQPDRVVGTTASATAAHVDQAVKAAAAALPPWRDTPVEKRAMILRKAAAILRERRDEFSAWEVFESAKPWREADGDVVEAIDYLEYYAQQAIRLGREQVLDVPGETNRYFYEPRGVGAVISPWNFPLAIALGMSVGPIAVGNTVVLKPAPQSPIIAAKFAELMATAGLPPGVLNYLPGGDEAGAALVKHEAVNFINFTGSRRVGLLINAVASQTPDSQHHLKHVLTEMGGKNAIIVDSDADLDDAVHGVAASAFGYAGQKCSACSRVIVVSAIHDAFVKRLVEAAASLRVGPAEDPGTSVPPVIDAEAKRNILAAIERGKTEAACALSVNVSNSGNGHYVGPTIFTGVKRDSSLAQHEIFGPVLAVMHARDFTEALELANSTAYALTGGVYSRSPANLDRARREFRVGNLYLNRKCTGAVVGRQPFGGMKMSGTDAKAGGPDYLLHFVEARCVTENTIRRGFAPPDPSPEGSAI